MFLALIALVLLALIPARFVRRSPESAMPVCRGPPQRLGHVPIACSHFGKAEG